VSEERRPGHRSRARSSFRLMLGATVLGFAGYAMLLPVVPLWTARGGSGELGAGATTGVLMLVTVVTQLAVPWLLVRWGHRVVLAAGMVLLGLPAPLLALSAELPLVLAVSAVRGVGFGLLTVAGSALVAELVPRAEHGRAAGRYGLAVGLPQLALLPAGVAVAEWVGFTPVFVVAGVAPLLGTVLVPAIRLPAERAAAGTDRSDGTGPRDRTTRAAGPAVTGAGSVGTPDPGRGAGWTWATAAGPVLAMLACSVAQGGLITFLPIAGAAPVVAAALLATSAGALLGRLAAGELVDRRGMGRRLLVPGMLLAAAGMVTELLSLDGGPGLVVGAAAVGVGFGLVQNDALTALFDAGGPSRYGSASALWNIAYDSGTGVGAVGLGAVAEPFGFRAAFGASAVLLVLAAGVVRAPGARP
jgi:MFS family permease